jgi:hypothetical protein
LPLCSCEALLASSSFLRSTPSIIEPLRSLDFFGEKCRISWRRYVRTLPGTCKKVLVRISPEEALRNTPSTIELFGGLEFFGEEFRRRRGRYAGNRAVFASRLAAALVLAIKPNRFDVRGIKVTKRLDGRLALQSTG